jgi:hypothetical protein
MITDQQFIDLLRKYEVLGANMNKSIAKALDNLELFKRIPLWLKIWRLDICFKCLLLSIKLKKLYFHKKELLEGMEELHLILKRKG